MQYRLAWVGFANDLRNRIYFTSMKSLMRSGRGLVYLQLLKMESFTYLKFEKNYFVRSRISQTQRYI